MEQALLAIVKKFPTHRETGRRMCCDVLVLDLFQENVCANNKRSHLKRKFPDIKKYDQYEVLTNYSTSTS